MSYFYELQFEKIMNDIIHTYVRTYTGVCLYHTDLLILCTYSSGTSSHSYTISHGKHRHIHLASNLHQDFNLLYICPYNLATY